MKIYVVQHKNGKAIQTFLNETAGRAYLEGTIDLELRQFDLIGSDVLLYKDALFCDNFECEKLLVDEESLRQVIETRAPVSHCPQCPNEETSDE